MGLKSRTERLERLAERDFLVIPKPDGRPVRFPPSAAEEAFMSNHRRKLGERVPEHPLSTAAARSGDPRWQGSFFAARPVGEVVGDLSE